MNAEDRMLCLLAQEYDEGELAALAGCGDALAVDWPSVFGAAEAHAVSPLVYSNLTALPALARAVPPAVLSGFKRAQVHSVLKKQGSHRALGQLVRACAQHHVDLLLVKGAALSLFVYRQPWSVISGDMDIVLRPDAGAPADLDAVIAFMERHNHTRNELAEHFEYELYGHHDVSMNDVLHIPPQALWQDAVRKELGGHPLFVLSPEMMLVAACVNACRKRYFYLKSLNDIAVLCRRFPALDWQAVGQRARAFRADTIVYAALWVTRLMLGSPIPAAAWRHLPVAPIRRGGIQAMAALLGRYGSLATLTQDHGTLLGRRLNPPLLLTYLSYRSDIVGGKAGEILRAWRTPPPPKPVPY